MLPEPPPSTEAAVLRYLLSLLLDSAPLQAWEALQSRGELAGAAAAYFLLDCQPRDSLKGGPAEAPAGGVEFFVQVTMRRLLRQLSRSTQRQLSEYRGRVRGRVAWSQTLKARYTQDYDPTRYVCSEVRHQYDTPENQLLKYLLACIQDCLKSVPEALRAGFCYTPAGSAGAGSIAQRLAQVEATLAQLQRNTRLRQISLPETVQEFHVLRALTSRTEEYADVARLYQHYQRVVAAPTWARLAEVGRRVLLLPGQRGPQADGWVQLGAQILRTGRSHENVHDPDHFLGF
ncbi:MAG: DUF2357 domain-containing protein [Chloroflexota bacterium]